MRKLSKEYYFELAQFLMDWHSGQWSRGYRLLCRLNVGGNWSESMANELRDTMAYEWLVEHYKGRV